MIFNGDFIQISNITRKLTAKYTLSSSILLSQTHTFVEILEDAFLLFIQYILRFRVLSPTNLFSSLIKHVPVPLVKF